jgi:hypothetical protein
MANTGKELRSIGVGNIEGQEQGSGVFHNGCGKLQEKWEEEEFRVAQYPLRGIPHRTFAH